MMRLKNVLLVDDDEITNYINQDLIKSLDIAENITILYNGQEALDYLAKAYEGSEKHIVPELIFLDINMPVMNGFQFLEEYYYKLGNKQLSTVVTMLTTSLIKEEVQRAMEMANVVKGYIEKPLTKEIVQKVYENYLEGKYKSDGKSSHRSAKGSAP
jgi:CheY-like chemotaxis protein